MDELRVLRVQRPAVRAVLVGAIADQQHDVGAGHEILQMAARAIGAHAVGHHAERQRRGFIDRAFAHVGRAHGQRHGLRELDQLVMGA
ncbi:hypothetical protein D3C86_1903390 [compost metagenome]